VKIQSGFTLIEILIALAIVATLAFATISLGSSWTSSAESVNTKGVLAQAIGRAKSTAMRNANKIADTSAAVAICLTSGKVEIHEASGTITSAHCNTSGGTTTWSGKIGTSLSIKSGSNTLSCLCFSNKGQLNTTASNCSSCASSTRFIFSGQGIEDETIAIY
jgi:prepilin-type N-terminal cleavage/methylation domain-containing protein